MEFTRILPIAFGFLSLVVTLAAAAAPRGRSTMPALCPGPKTTKVQERETDMYKNCSCSKARHQPGETTLCSAPDHHELCAEPRGQVVDPGYDGELTVKLGECKNSICRVKNITLGCKGVINATKIEDFNPQIGCAYTCTNKTTNTKEFNYIAVGSPCMHALPNGTFVQKTCQRSGDGILCRDKVDILPSC
ncbi:hypothetical protein V5799_024643 [Amblyomma americanum]|uniref:Secreted protein n=1 Tax=Amblyomma americanum TaxID=6943 RepID=A0AAQ4EBZ1_AMBAM